MFLVYILVFVHAEKTASSLRKKEIEKEGGSHLICGRGYDVTSPHAFWKRKKKTAEDLKHLEINVTFTAVNDVIYPL